MMVSIQTFAQLVKEENLTHYKRNTIMVAGKMLASSELYFTHTEIKFFDNEKETMMFFSLNKNEFRDVGRILSGYNGKDRDIYSLHMNHGGSLYIRFEKKYGHTKSYVVVRLGNTDYLFPNLNRIQYKRLFKDKKGVKIK